MADQGLVKAISLKYQAFLLDFDERGTRRWAAAEAISIGRRGITSVAQSTGIPDRTIRTGIGSAVYNILKKSVRELGRPLGGQKVDCRESKVDHVRLDVQKNLNPTNEIIH